MFKKCSLFVSLLISVLTHAQTGGYSIEVKLKNTPRKQLFLAYYLGDKQYIKDTADVVNNTAVFKGKEPLDYGMYMIVEPEANKFSEILIDDKDQNFYLEIDYSADQPWVDVQGSVVNKQFKSYIEYIRGKEKERKALEKQKAEESIKKLDKEVENYRLKFIKDHPGSLFTAMIKASQPLDPPTFSGTKEEKDYKNWQWHKSHWFDHIDMTDERMVRTKILAERVNYFTDKLTVQHPDSLILSVDEVLKLVMPAKENFRFCLQYLLNKYARSNIIGMDAVYAHLALEYYDKLKPDWIEQEQLDKIVKNAKKLTPLLIGKKAPDLQLSSVSGTKISLHEFDAKYSILFFYDSKSSVSTKRLPVLKTVADKFAAKGVKVITICVDNCSNLASFVNEKDMGSFFNTHDASGSNEVKTIYDLSTLPMVYLLDEQKIILSKRLGVDQLEKVLQSLGL